VEPSLKPTVPSLLSLIDEAFDHKAWHGTTLLGSIRGLDAATASRRPAPGRHNIWEIVVHAAYWKYAVRRRLTGEKRGSFAFAGSNWFVRPPQRAKVRRVTVVRGQSKAAEAAFKADVKLLIAEHRALRRIIASLSDAALEKKTGSVTKAFVVRGIAAHDLYHAGQIQLLKRLVSS
jgi:uncharacterized damage-inducible protein DinB